MAAVVEPVGSAVAAAAVVGIVLGGPAVAAVQEESELERHAEPLHNR